MRCDTDLLKCFIRNTIRAMITESWDSPEAIFADDSDDEASQEVDEDGLTPWDRQAALNNQLSRKDNYAWSSRSLASFKPIAPTKTAGVAGSSRRASPQFRIPRAYNSTF